MANHHPSCRAGFSNVLLQSIWRENVDLSLICGVLGNWRLEQLKPLLNPPGSEKSFGNDDLLGTLEGNFYLFGRVQMRLLLSASLNATSRTLAQQRMVAIHIRSPPAQD
jgi:hypothetical protein